MTCSPAACDTLATFFRETGTRPEHYDHVITGDLGHLGSEILLEMMAGEGYPLENHLDCGLLLFDRREQDMHCGASGCGCAASVLNGYLLNGLRDGKWKKLLFAPTGALLSPVSSFQGETIPGICHAILWESHI